MRWHEDVEVEDHSVAAMVVVVDMVVVVVVAEEAEVVDRMSNTLKDILSP